MAIKKSEVLEKPIYNNYEDYDFEDLMLYAGLDCITTSSVLAKIFPALSEEPAYHVPGPDGKPMLTYAKSLLQVNDEVTKIAMEYVIDMEINGIGYDVSKNREISARMVAEIAQLDEWLKPFIPEGINLSSGVEVVEFLYTTKGFSPPSFTATGEPSCDGSALLTLAGLNPLSPPRDYKTPNPELQYLAWMAKRKDISSCHNTFIKTYVEDFVKSDGRIHPSYNLHGTSGFRISGDTPNLTQLPRSKHGYNIRECYNVRPGYVMIMSDFSSAEVKVLGAICKDPNILKAINENMDFHSFSASSMLGISYEEFLEVLGDKTNDLYKEYKDYRQTAKTLTFSIIYGSTAGGIAMQLNVSKTEAERLMALYFDAYPGVKTFIEETHHTAKWNHEIVNEFGQRKKQYGTHDCFKPTAAYNASLRNGGNFKIQSATSTLGLLTFAALNEAVKKIGGMSICTVYDSTELEVPIERMAEAIELSYYYLNDYPQTVFPWLGISIGCEVEMGLNWGTCKEVHRGVTQQECEEILASLS